ncbi:radical SAM family heme chaperone HemW [Aliiroseovarius subalbicans]|uniref:radical SAM family heme chaperone HemW n=1 Tax=Aliiroseovarius subalbicans TaxID=2925840 RepID=UPI001F563FAE|nr:radical SAM family heme chaperone HemW [Aliiroseovarius subalbicans]MCI2400061.1 radical SAM family heme chaperone HemW [Aliiroseovarius subalbicans]
MPENWQEAGFGLYLHWPFCAAKCPYCDFNSHVSSSIDQDAWQAAYLSEIDRYAALTPGRVLDSVYFGGGTPSLMRPDVVSALLDRVASHWTLANDVEITLEANPTSIEAANFAGYRAGGVNRVSIGVQALNDEDLRRLGRMHSMEEAKQALILAKTTFERVNFDLIYARQDQSLDAWRAELTQALAMEPDHLSLYQLTIEPGTAFGDRFAAGGLHGLPGDDLSVDQFFLTQELCEKAGLPAYEVSNHAKPGQESRHNLVYWRGGDWIGIGPGAHGRLTLGGSRIGTETELNPLKWLANPAQNIRETLALDEQATEYLLMGLRLQEGIDLLRLRTRYGVTLKDSKIKDLLELSLIEIEGDILKTSREGRPVLNAILRELVPD